ncbi:hypothetical protein GCT13_25970 [Paraburkholderia sp. CNPSo 3157]|uniref:Uncharacterized protein n=1 Tax=Paraburkholderia franconis TaxID=2654983 RepID=A0A7X1NE71_9BURK|nr:hypothetical protein [Paraburkholderia franconis]
MSSTGGVSPLSLLTFFAAAKKVSAAPHRGNARAARRNRGCRRQAIKTKTKAVTDTNRNRSCPR